VTGLQRDLSVLEQLAYLHGATLRIGASMDADRAILALCETAIPCLADFATAYLLDTATSRSLAQQQGSREVLVRQVAVAEEGWDQILVGKLPLHDLAGPFAETMSTGQTVVWPAQGDNLPPADLGGLLPAGGPVSCSSPRSGSTTRCRASPHCSASRNGGRSTTPTC